MRRLSFILFFILFLPVACFAATKAPAPTPIAEFIHEVLSLVIKGLATALAGLIVGWAYKALQRIGLEINFAKEADAKEKLRDIIIGVEEDFLARHGIEDKAKRGAEKLGEAAAKAVTRIPFLKGCQETAKRWILEELPKLGLGALGKKNGNKPVGAPTPEPKPEDPQ